MTETALLGAGCFWGIEETYRQTPGVVSTSVGYAGGHTDNPTYREVCSGTTGHAEVVRVEFDPDRISYDELLTIFWDNHNPTTPNRQGPDIGTQYRSVIFYADDTQREAAESSRDRLAASGRYSSSIVTELQPAPTFYPAEDYHQQYFAKRGGGHCGI